MSNLLGAMYAAVLFLGGTNTSAVQSVVAIERTVFYREKAAGMFSALPYAFAQVINRNHNLLCDIPFHIGCVTSTNVIARKA